MSNFAGNTSALWEHFAGSSARGAYIGLSGEIWDATLSAIQTAGLTAGLKAATAKANAIGALYDDMTGKVDALVAAIDKGCPCGMKAAIEDARVTVDALESIVDAVLWPVPTYAQMLNIHSK